MDGLEGGFLPQLYDIRFQIIVVVEAVLYTIGHFIALLASIP